MTLKSDGTHIPDLLNGRSSYKVWRTDEANDTLVAETVYEDVPVDRDEVATALRAGIASRRSS